MAVNTGKGKLTKHDDFDRPVLGTLDWTVNQGNSATNFAINTQVNGVVRGTVTNNSRNDRAILINGIDKKATGSGPLVFEARVAIATSLSVSVFAGLTAAVTVHIPLEWSNGAFTANATDAVGFYHGAAVGWKYGGVANSVAGAQATAGASFNPVLATFQTLRVVVNSSGKASFTIDGKLLAENVALSVTAATLLGAQVSIRDDGAAGSFDVDYIHTSVGRV